MVEAKLVPIFSLLLGGATGFILRDELNMPTYMRIKTATIEHRMLSRTKLDIQIDKSQEKPHEIDETTMEEHYRKLVKMSPEMEAYFDKDNLYP